ncbi:GGDEF domain-containing protein [Mycobacterium ahvazicum]|uniref:GGDEF domain-containing protein n=1 Tax=Mycobacterium ahvazicum TaxID=1964395 RepID=A0A2K4YAY4_9MYCO|nr:GGDEF domain-containing protein [Mycobacterium ahvazicum]
MEPVFLSGPPPTAARSPRFGDAEYLERMERLLQAVQDLSLARSQADIQQLVSSSARELTSCDGATLVLRDNGKCFYAEENAIGPLWKGLRFPMTSCISGWAMLHRDAVIIPNIYLDSRIPHDLYRPTFVRAW